MLTKKDSAGLCTEKKMCRDYRPLNLVTPQDMYPMSIPEELFDSDALTSPLVDSN
jgi:hypothetical protein